jgi:riboflavin kinase/FMN adenylyltransferase
VKVMLGASEWHGKPLCLALGVFDGLHLGHREVVGETVRLARARGVLPAVLTFDPHPSAVVDPQGAPPLLTTTEEKLDLLKGLGVGLAVVARFDRALADLSAREFVEQVLVGRLRARCVVVGEGWRFGAKGAGTPALLRRLGREFDFGVLVAPRVVVSGRKVSSTRIRELLLRGRVGAANELLGRNYELQGPVVRGDGLGAELGFPTANLEIPAGKLIPADGIYACRAGLTRLRPAVVYIGHRPTVATMGERRVEVHLLPPGPRTPLLHKRVRAELVERLRSDKRFATQEALARQMRRDCDEARRVLQRTTRAR